MHKIAIFISGRLLGYETSLLPLINNIKTKYNIFLFFSINTFSLEQNDRNTEKIESIKNDLKQKFGDCIGEIYFEEYKFPKSYIDNKLKNKIYNFSNYNQLSCFYNDKNNFELIENYEIDNNINFDIICKLRSDLFFEKNNIDFIIDNKDELIIRNKHSEPIRHWGHIHKDTPLMISDAFAYGNKISMNFYCSTYKWILDNDISMKGEYKQTFEIYLTDSILQYIFYNIPGGEKIPLLNKEQINEKFKNNPNRLKIIVQNINYTILDINIRTKNNFIVDMNNVFEYTQI